MPFELKKMQIHYIGIDWLKGWRDLIHYILGLTALVLFITWLTPMIFHDSNYVWILYFSVVISYILLDKIAHRITGT